MFSNSKKFISLCSVTSFLIAGLASAGFADDSKINNELKKKAEYEKKEIEKKAEFEKKEKRDHHMKPTPTTAPTPEPTPVPTPPPAPAPAPTPAR